MDETSTSILCQVAFKEAGECARQMNLDLLDQQGQASFEELYSYLTESLFLTVRSQVGTSAGQLVQGAFPGSTVVPQPVPQANQGWNQQPAPQGGAVGPHNYQITVKGTQHAALPDWLYPLAARDNVHEVYDNRDAPPGSRRPMFKSTSGGRDAPAYWEPGR